MIKTTINENDFSAYLSRLLKIPANRQAYYASRAWQMRRQGVALRSSGKCERCKSGRFQLVHHLTYAHFGAEYMNELQGLCRDCHAYLHYKSDYDPCNDPNKAIQLSLFSDN